MRCENACEGRNTYDNRRLARCVGLLFQVVYVKTRRQKAEEDEMKESQKCYLRNISCHVH